MRLMSFLNSFLLVYLLFLFLIVNRMCIKTIREFNQQNIVVEKVRV